MRIRLNPCSLCDEEYRVSDRSKIQRMRREQANEEQRRKRNPIEDPEGEKALDELHKSIEEQKKAMESLTNSMSNLLSVH